MNVKTQPPKSRATARTTVAAAKARLVELDTLIARLVELSEEASAAGSYPAATNALSRVGTFQAERRRCKTAVDVAGTDDPILQVDMMLAQALEDGSMAAAATLMDQRRALNAERAAAEEKAREDAARATDPVAMQGELIEALRSLPPDQATVIRESLGWI